MMAPLPFDEGLHRLYYQCMGEYLRLLLTNQQNISLAQSYSKCSSEPSKIKMLLQAQLWCWYKKWIETFWVLVISSAGQWQLVKMIHLHLCKHTTCMQTKINTRNYHNQFRDTKFSTDQLYMVLHVCSKYIYMYMYPHAKDVALFK